MIHLMTLIKQWLATSSKKQKLTAGLLVFSSLATVALLILNGSSKTTGDPLGSTPLYFVAAFIKLIGVLLLIVTSAVILRRWFQIGPNGKTGNQLHLLETVRLSPKQAIHLISIGDQRLLIGATDQNVSLLSPIEGSFSPMPAETTNHQPGLDFGSLLQSFNVHPSAESKGLKTTNEE